MWAQGPHASSPTQVLWLFCVYQARAYACNGALHMSKGLPLSAVVACQVMSSCAWPTQCCSAVVFTAGGWRLVDSLRVQALMCGRLGAVCAGCNFVHS
jgi:hypothetical protein